MNQVIPKNLLSKLKCSINQNSNLKYDIETNLLITDDPSITYSVHQGIPSMMTINDGPEAQDWNIWSSEDIHKMGDSYYKRAKGELPEKEASKSYARLIKNKKELI